MTKNKPKVSVLVPIYNVEKYLRQCLESITAQTLQDIEIICINDGSTDGSLDIIKDFAKNDNRIVIIDKPNSGYGDSMNQGLEKATGEYIGIVESDDWIELDAFERLYALAKNHNAEIVRANYYFNKANKDTKNYYIDPTEVGVVKNPTQHNWIFMQAPAIWSAIYKRDFLNKNHIRFLPTPGASYQDTGFNFKALACARRALFTTDAFLHYRTDNEASSVNSTGKAMNVCYEYAEIEKFLTEHNLIQDLYSVMLVAKLGAYIWNMERLTKNLLQDFIKNIQDDLKRFPDLHTVIDSFSLDDKQRQTMHYIVDHNPAAVARYIGRNKLQKKLRSSLKRAWTATHPAYKKQLQLSELIADLHGEIDSLETKLKELEAKHHE